MLHIISAGNEQPVDTIRAAYYPLRMIASFKGKFALQIWNREPSKFPRELQRRALLRLAAIHSAESIDDLRIPPGNKLKMLQGDRKGQYSVRINEQWRICFNWDGKDAHHVEIVDYH